MNQLLDKSKTFNYKTPITILSLFALVGAVLSFVTDFIYLCYMNYLGVQLLLTLFNWLVSIVPCILLALYALKFHKENNAKIFMSIIFGAFAFYALLRIVEGFVFYFYSYTIIAYIIYIAQFVAFLFATISALKNFSNKISPIIALCVGLVTQAYYLLEFLMNITVYIRYAPLYLLIIPMEIIVSVALYIALLLFVLNNNTSADDNKEKDIRLMTPEQAIRYLNGKVALGEITEEEYQAKRAEIISKL